VYEIDADFYDKYVYENLKNRPKKEDIPLKSMMEVDVNPHSNWLIFFVKDRFSDDNAAN
jgi:hypothetical protein